MKKLLLLTGLVVCQALFAQKEPTHIINFENMIDEVFIHQFTGVTIVSTTKIMYAVDGEKGEIIWETKGNEFQGLLNSLGQEGGLLYKEIPMSSLLVVGKEVIDIYTGKKIISPDIDQYVKIKKFEFVPELLAVLIQTQTEKGNKFFLIGADQNNKLWETEVKVAKKNAGFDNLKVDVLSKSVVLSVKDETVLFDGNTGALLWLEKNEPGMFEFIENKLVVVEKKGGSLIGETLKAGLTMGLSLLGRREFGKKISAYDLAKKEEAWKKSIKLDENFIDIQVLENKNMFVIHKDGANLYNLDAGKALWKKDFGKKNIQFVEKNTEGYLVYYKSLMHQLDGHGKKIWKKPQRVNISTTEIDFEVEDDEDNFATFKYDSGTIIVTPYRILYYKKGEEKKTWRFVIGDKSKLTYDSMNKNLIVLEKKKLYIFNPDTGKDKNYVVKVPFKRPNKIEKVELRDNGYFISGPFEYALTDTDGNLIKHNYYEEPGGLLRNVVAVTSSIANTYSQVAIVNNVFDWSSGSAGGMMESMIGPNEFTSIYGNYNSANKAYNSAKFNSAIYSVSKDLQDYTAKRGNFSKEIENYAFLFGKEDELKLLAQVDKDSGEEVNKFIFDNNKPIYTLDKAKNLIYYVKGKALKVFNY